MWTDSPRLSGQATGTGWLHLHYYPKGKASREDHLAIAASVPKVQIQRLAKVGEAPATPPHQQWRPDLLSADESRFHSNAGPRKGLTGLGLRDGF